MLAHSAVSVVPFSIGELDGNLGSTTCLVNEEIRTIFGMVWLHVMQAPDHSKSRHPFGMELLDT